jgi:hypothetical protein
VSASFFYGRRVIDRLVAFNVNPLFFAVQSVGEIVCRALIVIFYFFDFMMFSNRVLLMG